MKKILFVLTVLLTTSCASLNQKNRDLVEEYDKQMSLLKVDYPEIYELYKKRIVVIDKIYTYTDKNNGQEHVSIKYHRP